MHVQHRVRARRLSVLAIGAATLLLVAGCGFIPRHQLAATETALLEASPKPAPMDSSFEGCDANGSPPDGFLNLRKNRVDDVGR